MRDRLASMEKAEASGSSPVNMSSSSVAMDVQPKEAMVQASPKSQSDSGEETGLSLSG